MCHVHILRELGRGVGWKLGQGICQNLVVKDCNFKESETSPHICLGIAIGSIGIFQFSLMHTF